MKMTYLIILINTEILRFDERYGENVKNNDIIRLGEEPTNLSKEMMTILKIPVPPLTILESITVQNAIRIGPAIYKYKANLCRCGQNNVSYTWKVLLFRLKTVFFCDRLGNLK